MNKQVLINAGLIYPDAADNRAYMDGFISAKKADGIDWAKARLALIELEQKTRSIIAAKDAEIADLKARLRVIERQYEDQILDLESQIEAHRIAWRHRNEAI